MFSTSDTPPAPARSPGHGSNLRSVLSSDLKIVGEIRSSGAIEVQGEVDGTIVAQSLSIGQEGRVAGDITADQVEIRGKMDGQVVTQGFTLRGPAQVTADVTYTTLVIESGAQIEGRFQKAR